MRQIAVVLAVLAAGCSKPKEEANSAFANAVVNAELAKRGEHVDLGAMQSAAKQLQEATQAPARPIVGFQKLTPLLPDAPAGWTADKPEGSTMNTPQMQISQASRRYQKGNASMKLTIMDGMAAAASGLAMLAGVSEESSKGFRKPYSAGGLLGSEEWTAASKHVDIQLLTKKRFLIGFDGTGLDGVEVGERMIAKLDPAKLDALAQ